ncbi:GOLPH3/VPS74 family protein [Parafrankia sp. FMc2]|uniref:GOLPH3/VPS74 family protein n=1 Tax=Parafrankia sp. FMc2 TaxID=3233196 RepID=UPI0034D4FC79
MDITMAEKFLLLALDENGKDIAGVGADVGLAAALVAELTEAGHLRFDDGVLVAGADGPGADADPLLRAAHEAVLHAGTPVGLETALAALPQAVAPLWETVARALVERGILAEEKGRVALVFRVTRHPVSEPAPVQAVRERLAAVLTSARAATPADAALLGALQPFGLAAPLVPAERRAEAGALAAAVAGTTAFGEALRAAVDAVRVSLLAALAASSAGGAAASG